MTVTINKFIFFLLIWNTLAYFGLFSLFFHLDPNQEKSYDEHSSVTGQLRCIQGMALKDVKGNFMICGGMSSRVAATCPANYYCYFDGTSYGCCPTQNYTCSLPPESGALCQPTVIRWFYNYTLRTCEPYLFNGCRGNSNNFASKKSCQNYCLPRTLGKVFLAAIAFFFLDAIFVIATMSLKSIIWLSIFCFSRLGPLVVMHCYAETETDLFLIKIGVGRIIADLTVLISDMMEDQQNKKITEFCRLYDPNSHYPKPLFVGNILWTNFRNDRQNNDRQNNDRHYSILVIRNNEIAFHSFNAIGSLAAPPFDTLIPDDITRIVQDRRNPQRLNIHENNGFVSHVQFLCESESKQAFDVLKDTQFAEAAGNTRPESLISRLLCYVALIGVIITTCMLIAAVYQNYQKTVKNQHGVNAMELEKHQYGQENFVNIIESGENVHPKCGESAKVSKACIKLASGQCNRNEHWPEWWWIPANWPFPGHIQFRNVSLHSGPQPDLVLHNVNFQVAAREKVAIFGRSQTDISALLLALFRSVEINSGQIMIADIDIYTIGIHSLRQAFIIIPRNPIPFCGSLRLNLDPFGEYQDEAIWDALEKAHLKEQFSQWEGGLSHEVPRELSTGQRQLICLARAILQNLTRILVLEEADAIDWKTHVQLQEAIRNHFKHSTVLTIGMAANRPNYILKYDRILVMDAGRVAEFDSPTALRTNSSSIFSQLAQQHTVTGSTGHDYGLNKEKTKQTEMLVFLSFMFFIAFIICSIIYILDWKEYPFLYANLSFFEFLKKVCVLPLLILFYIFYYFQITYLNHYIFGLPNI